MSTAARAAEAGVTSRRRGRGGQRALLGRRLPVVLVLVDVDVVVEIEEAVVAVGHGSLRFGIGHSNLRASIGRMAAARAAG